MTIDAYVGNPGAGKSHGVMKSVVLPALLEGRRVVHNMPILDEGVRALVGAAGELVAIPEGMTAAKFVAWFRAEHMGALLVLDEAWRYWASGLKASNIPEAEKEFFAMHRHMVGMTPDGRTTDIAFVTQNLGQIASFIRDLVDQTFHYQKLGFVGASNRYRCDVYTGPVSGPKPPVSKRTNSFQGKYDPKVFKCYRSHTLSAAGTAGVEKKVDDRGNILKSWKFRGAVLAACVVPLVLYGAVHSFHAIGKPKSKAGEAQSGEAVGVKPQAPSPPKPAGPDYSKEWRYAGMIQIGRRVRWTVTSGNGARVLDRGCERDSSGEWTCKVDGQLVTAWSGVPPPDPLSAFVGASATPPTIASRAP